MHQHLLDSIAGRRVVRFGVQHDLGGHAQVGGLQVSWRTVLQRILHALLSSIKVHAPVCICFRLTSTGGQVEDWRMNCIALAVADTPQAWSAGDGFKEEKVTGTSST